LTALCFCFKLKYDLPLSNFSFNVNLRPNLRPYLTEYTHDPGFHESAGKFEAGGSKHSTDVGIPVHYLQIVR